MDSLLIFIIIFIEVANFMLLWNLFNKNLEKRFIKSMIIVFTASLLVVLMHYVYTPVEFAINYLFLFLLIKLMFKKRVKHLLLEFSLVLTVCGIIQLVTILLLRTVIAAFMSKDIFYNNLTANIITLFISFFIYKFVSYEKLHILYKQESSKIYFISINLLIYMIIAKLIWNFKRQMFFEEIVLFLLIPAIFIFGNMVFLVYHTKNNELKKSLEEYKKYSTVISSLLDDAKRKQHDFKNHLNTIYGLIQVSDERTLKETVRQYMNSVSDSLENIGRVLQINNKVVTAIIYNKINEAAKSKIRFKYIIQYESVRFPFKDYELSEILNNLLDNAFEAVENSDMELKKVFLNIGCLEDGAVIEIGNTGKRIEFNEIGKIFNRGYTTKSGEGHGYGLSNVKKIVEAYGGRIQLSFENKYTIFRVIL